MTFSNLDKIDPLMRMHRVQITDFKKADEAVLWCKENLFEGEWANEVFDNFDCFYFENRTMCSLFMFVFGGKYIAPPRGYDD